MAHAQPVVPALQADEGELAQRARAHVERSGAKGLVLAIVRADGARVIAAAGESGREGSPVLDADTLFEIGSITKAFNGLVVADMVRRGEMALDDAVERHLAPARAWREGGPRSVTLRQLLTHTSGLPRLPSSATFYLAMARNPANPYRHYSREDLFAYLAQAEVPRGTHGVAYSNLGAGLLGHVVEARAGKPWEYLARERVMAPLGMSSTFIEVPVAESGRLARGHGESGRAAAYWDTPALAAAGALRSSANDLAKLVGAALNAHPPFHPGFFTPLADIRGRAVGHGWFRRAGRAGEIWWHNGGTGGFRSFVGVMPARGVGVIALSNSAISVDGIAFELLGEPPVSAPTRGTSAGMYVFAGLALWVAGLLATFRYGPRDGSGGRRWLRAREDTGVGLAAAMVEAIGVTILVVAFAPFPPLLLAASGALLAFLVARMAWRFTLGARAAGGPRWMPEERRGRALARLAAALLATGAIAAFALA